MISVLVVDDHSMVRAGLQQLLASATDIEVVGLAVNGAEAVELAGHMHPDVVLMDLQMPVLSATCSRTHLRTRSLLASGLLPGVSLRCILAPPASCSRHEQRHRREGTSSSPHERPRCSDSSARGYRTSRLPGAWESPSGPSRHT